MANSEIIGAGQNTAHRAPKINTCGDGAVVAQSLFQLDIFYEKDGGLIPTSPLQLVFERCDIKLAVELNRKWNSRVPELGNAFHCFAYCAKFDGKYYAVALWSHPVARHFNGKGYLELRRMAICSEAPKFTASRMISRMTKDIFRSRKEICKLISYQDCAVHKGTIYKACGWIPSYYRDRGKEKAWTNRIGRVAQTGTDIVGKCNSAKMRWEKDIRSPVLGEESPAQNTMEICHTAPNSASMQNEQMELNLL